MSNESGSKQSVRTQLIALGSDNLEASEERLARLVEQVPIEEFVADLALSADVDLALENSTRLQVADPILARKVFSDPHARLRWLLLCGASPYLADFCLNHPETLHYFFYLNEGDFSPTASLMQSLASIDLAAGKETLTEAHINQLRIAYRQQLVRIALQDLTGESSFDKTTLHLSDLADATLEAAFMLASRNIHLHSDADFAVIAMGKTGGQELNYISDVDVLFVVSDVSAELQEHVLSQSQQLARLIIHILMSHQTELPLWQIDANLRPEGKDGALVRTLSSYEQYYDCWAETWEFQALLKARPMAGSKALAEKFVEMTEEFVWSVAKRDNFVQDVQHMRKRVIENIPEAHAQRELKLGVGGLRDIEFAVQLLQMVHGANDVSIRSANTLRALEALSQWGYVARDDAHLMREIYMFERELEHRIQMYAMAPTHLIPENEADLRRLARLLGFKSNPYESLHKQLNQYRSEARRLHEKLFYKPLLQAVARVDTDVVRMSLDAAIARLAALGFIDPEAALRHIEFLTAGVSRRAIIQRNLLPVVLSWMAETPNPDGGLLGFRNLSEALGDSPWYLKLLRDESLVLKRLSHILCVSPFIARMLERTPEAMSMLADDAMLTPRSIESLREEMQHTGVRQPSIEDSIQAIRNIRQRELIRIATADIFGIIETNRVLSSLTDLTDACMQSAIYCYEHFYSKPGGRISLIGLGRFGGQEMSYASDADVMVVFDSSNDKDALTSYVFDMIPTLQQLFAKPAVDPALVLDFDLRPEGRQGPIAKSLQSYREYYERWSLTWESQALLRARFVAGDAALGHEFLELIENLRYPVEGLSDASVRDIRAMKARVESERLPRGVDPKLHLKLGPGGLSDIEWLVQFVQLLHAGKFPTLKTVSTLEVLKQLPNVIGLAPSDVEHCTAVWLFASRLRNYLLLVDSKERDVLTLQPQTLKLLSYLLDEESTFDVVEHWLRLARRARKVFTSVVYQTKA